MLPPLSPEFWTSRPADFASCDIDETAREFGRRVRPHRVRAVASDRAYSLTLRSALSREVAFFDTVMGGASVVEADPDDRCHFLMAPLAGAFAVSAGGRETDLMPGQAVLIPAGVPFRLEIGDVSENLLIKIRHSLVDRLAGRLLADCLPRPLAFETLARIDGPARDTILVLAGLLAPPSRPGGPARVGRVRRRPPQTPDDALALHLLSVFPHDARARLEGREALPRPFYVRRAEALIHDAAATDLSLAALARAACVSSRTLARGFRRYRGCSPQHYVRAVRLDRARAALEAGARVYEAADAAGFSNASRFARAYGQRFGEYPSDTRAAVERS